MPGAEKAATAQPFRATRLLPVDIAGLPSNTPFIDSMVPDIGRDLQVGRRAAGIGIESVEIVDRRDGNFGVVSDAGVMLRSAPFCARTLPPYDITSVSKERPMLPSESTANESPSKGVSASPNAVTICASLRNVRPVPRPRSETMSPSRIYSNVAVAGRSAPSDRTSRLEHGALRSKGSVGGTPDTALHAEERAVTKSDLA